MIRCGLPKARVACLAMKTGQGVDYLSGGNCSLEVPNRQITSSVPSTVNAAPLANPKPLSGAFCAKGRAGPDTYCERSSRHGSCCPAAAAPRGVAAEGGGRPKKDAERRR